MKPLAEGDRIVVKFREGPVMGYFMSYYNDYALVDLDDDHVGSYVTRRIVRRAPAAVPPPPANVQIFEAATPTHNQKKGGLNG